MEHGEVAGLVLAFTLPSTRFRPHCHGFSTCDIHSGSSDGSCHRVEALVAPPELLSRPVVGRTTCRDTEVMGRQLP